MGNQSLTSSCCCLLAIPSTTCSCHWSAFMPEAESNAHLQFVTLRTIVKGYNFILNCFLACLFFFFFLSGKELESRTFYMTQNILSF